MADDQHNTVPNQTSDRDRSRSPRNRPSDTERRRSPSTDSRHSTHSSHDRRESSSSPRPRHSRRDDYEDDLNRNYQVAVIFLHRLAAHLHFYFSSSFLVIYTFPLQ